MRTRRRQLGCCFFGLGDDWWEGEEKEDEEDIDEQEDARRAELIGRKVYEEEQRTAVPRGEAVLRVNHGQEN